METTAPAIEETFAELDVLRTNAVAEDGTELTVEDFGGELTGPSAWNINAACL